jgi:hypothetical protein
VSVKANSSIPVKDISRIHVSIHVKENSGFPVKDNSSMPIKENSSIPGL